MAGVKLASVAAVSEQPHGSGEPQRKQESSPWELRDDNSGEREDTTIVSCLVCRGRSRLLDLCSQSERTCKVFYPLSASQKSIVLPPFAGDKWHMQFLQINKGLGSKEDLRSGHLFHWRLDQISKTGTGSSAFLADDS